MMDLLKKFRTEIDKIDRRILKLLNDRAKISLKVGNLKSKNGIDFYHPARQKMIIKKLEKINRGPLDSVIIENIYREIFSGSIALQHRIRIAFLGHSATFTHQAAIRAFGNSVLYESRNSIPEIFASVENGDCDYGVVPIENSHEGIITHTLDMFLESQLKIVSEVLIEISHYLLSKEKNRDRIKYLFSHPQAIDQCNVWIKNNLGSVKVKETSSTAEAAMLVSKSKNTAAIAGKIAAEVYKLNILGRNIQGSGENKTRFFIIGRNYLKTVKKLVNYKTSIICGVKDKPGALYHILKPLAENRVNMTKIESRPTRSRPLRSRPLRSRPPRKAAGESLFFMDMKGSLKERKIADSLKRIEKEASYFRMLGSYPQAL